MAYKLFDYVDGSGTNLFREWTQRLQKPARAKLNQKLDSLASNGEALFPHLLTNCGEPHILKLRVHGNVAWRPLLCRGPISVGNEYTLLAGAQEVNFVLTPPNIEATAEARRKDVLANNRRTQHVRVAG